MSRTFENIYIRKATVELIRKATAALSVKRGGKVFQAQFIHEAIEEKIEREKLETVKK